MKRIEMRSGKLVKIPNKVDKAFASAIRKQKLDTLEKKRRRSRKRNSGVSW